MKNKDKKNKDKKNKDKKSPVPVEPPPQPKRCDHPLHTDYSCPLCGV